MRPAHPGCPGKGPHWGPLRLRAGPGPREGGPGHPQTGRVGGSAPPGDPLAAGKPPGLRDVRVCPSRRGPGDTGGRHFFKEQETPSDDKEEKLLGAPDVSGGDRPAFATQPCPTQGPGPRGVRRQAPAGGQHEDGQDRRRPHRGSGQRIRARHSGRVPHTHTTQTDRCPRLSGPTPSV